MDTPPPASAAMRRPRSATLKHLMSFLASGELGLVREAFDRVHALERNETFFFPYYFGGAAIKRFAEDHDRSLAITKTKDGLSIRRLY